MIGGGVDPHLNDMNKIILFFDKQQCYLSSTCSTT